MLYSRTQHLSRNPECGKVGIRFRVRGRAAVFLYANRRVFFTVAQSELLEEDRAADLCIRRNLKVTGVWGASSSVSSRS
jgi:hypothetical protein